MGKKQVNNLVRQVKIMYKGKNAIIAIEKGDYVEMRKDEYKNFTDLLSAIQKWNKAGFIVRYTKRGLK